MNIPNTKDIYELLQRFNSFDNTTLKYNLYNTCKELYVWGDKTRFMLTTGLTEPQFNSMVNVGHKGNVTFDNFITICYNCNLDIDDLLTDHNLAQSYTSRNKCWTDSTKRDFLDNVANVGITITSQEYGLSEKTVMHYVQIFTRELRINDEI